MSTTATGCKLELTVLQGALVMHAQLQGLGVSLGGRAPLLYANDNACLRKLEGPTP